VFIYWLQPSTPIRHLDFWLPTVCLSLVIFSWLLTSQKGAYFTRSSLLSSLVIGSVILLIGLPRYLGNFCCLTPTRPPEFIQILIALFIVLILSVLLVRIGVGHPGWLIALSALILLLFVVLKSEQLARLASMGLRSITAQPVSLATGLDIRWLGFSYVAFRLLHTVRDRISGRLPDLSLQEYVIYIIFFPSFTAGPIDRVQRFIADLHQPIKITTEHAFEAGRQILLGIFSKFVLADGLASSP